MNNQQTKNKHFTYEERVKIETLLEIGCSKRKIGREIWRPKSSICGEIRKNSVKGIYTAKKAHLKTYQRRWRAKCQAMKIAMNALLRNYVEEKLKRFWSPEGISGRLKNIDRHLPYVGKDTIYGYVKSVYGRNLESFLWYKGKRKKTKNYTKVSQLQNRTFIDQRPKYIDKRRFFGDWEADFIVSGKRGKGALLVFVERKSRYVLIFKLADRKVATINFILQKLCGAQLVVNSLTIDNDICFRHHEEMSRIMGAPIYFCHPYHSWEKGTVENTNKYIRRDIPKGSNISTYSKRCIRSIERKLQRRIMDVLDHQTPKEVLLKVRQQKKRRSAKRKMLKVKCSA